MFSLFSLRRFGVFWGGLSGVSPGSLTLGEQRVLSPEKLPGSVEIPEVFFRILRMEKSWETPSVSTIKKKVQDCAFCKKAQKY